ncbi:MAG: hypothetical protein LBU09_00895 [Endomicrobium sp.]|jgi:hypothetical protein|nr:hypothetical protein [Endomicrobium sp.]
MKKFVFFTATLCLISFFRCASVSEAAGENVFEFLKIPTTAAQGALAGMTGFNSEGGAHSHAMLDFAQGHSIGASYAAYFQDTSFNSLSFTLAREKYVLNFSYAGFYYGDMEGYREDSSGNYIYSGKFGANDLALGAGAGFAVLECLSLGCGLKYVAQNIDGEGIYGIAANLSAVYLPDANWYATLGLENFGPDVEGYRMPSNIYAGMYSFYEKIHVLVGAELKYYTAGSFLIKAAGEFDLVEKLFIRVGYSYPISNSNSELGDFFETNLSLGFGASYKPFSFDFAWMPFGQLGSVSMITLTINL